MAPTPSNEDKFAQSIEFLQETIQKLYEKGETSNEIKRNMEERIDKIVSEVTMDLTQLPEGSHSGTYGIGVGMIKSTYDLFITHSKAWKAGNAAASAAQDKGTFLRSGSTTPRASAIAREPIVAGYYTESSTKPNHRTFHRFDTSTPSRPASRAGISDLDDSPSRNGRQPAKLPPQRLTPRSKNTDNYPRTPWDEWAEAEAAETKKWGEDLNRMNPDNFENMHYPPPPPDTYDKYANVPPTYYSPRPRHAHVQYMMPHNVMERPRYVSNAANFRTGRTPPDRPRRMMQPEYTRY